MDLSVRLIHLLLKSVTNSKKWPNRDRLTEFVPLNLNNGLTLVNRP